jgi:hypothetical protein
VLLEDAFAAGETYRTHFCNLQELFTAYCRSREAVKLFTFLLSLYSVIGSCKCAELYISLMGKDWWGEGSYKFMYYVRGSWHHQV